MGTVVSRTWYNALVDDSGTGTDGSVWDKADVDSILDIIDALFTVNGATIIAFDSTAARGGGLVIQRSGATKYYIGTTAGISGSGSSDDMAIFTETGFGISFMTNGSATPKINIASAGHLTPQVDNVLNCGDASHRWALVRGTTITSGDLRFENGWTFTESYKVGIADPGIAILDADHKLIAFIGPNGLRASVEDLPYVRTTTEERALMGESPEVGTFPDPAEAVIGAVQEVA
jgi:hypothetical protein